METSGSVQKPRYNPPHGTEPYDVGGEDDLGALNDEQQRKLNDFKVTMLFIVMRGKLHIGSALKSLKLLVIMLIILKLFGMRMLTP